jgi:hypothetical protein
MSVAKDRRGSVRRRARDACEYCCLPQRASLLPHHVDHIIASQHQGSDDESNLCLCCLRPNIAALDPATGDVVRLFHARLQSWSEHYRVREDHDLDGARVRVMSAADALGALV